MRFQNFHNRPRFLVTGLEDKDDKESVNLDGCSLSPIGIPLAIDEDDDGDPEDDKADKDDGDREISSLGDEDGDTDDNGDGERDKSDDGDTEEGDPPEEAIPSRAFAAAAARAAVSLIVVAACRGDRDESANIDHGVPEVWAE